MAESWQDDNNDALVMVHVRNAFYKKKYYHALGICFLSICVIVALIYMLFYVIRKPVEPLYFVTDKLGRLLPDIPVTSPNMSMDDVSNWVIKATEAAYSYDFVNYRAQLQNAQKYFTDYGWRTYMSGLTASNNLLALTQRKLVISAKVIERPKLVVQGILGGAYAYKFEIPLLVSYWVPPYNDASRFSNPLILTVVAQRQPMLTSDMGLGIVQMIGRFATNPQQQNLSQTPTP